MPNTTPQRWPGLLHTPTAVVVVVVVVVVTVTTVAVTEVAVVAVTVVTVAVVAAVVAVCDGGSPFVTGEVENTRQVLSTHV